MYFLSSFENIFKINLAKVLKI